VAPTMAAQNPFPFAGTAGAGSCHRGHLHLCGRRSRGGPPRMRAVITGIAATSSSLSPLATPSSLRSARPDALRLFVGRRTSMTAPTRTTPSR
jgi:hypothetical protein